MLTQRHALCLLQSSPRVDIIDILVIAEKGAGSVTQIIIHVDMDAFYASVEVRDNPSLAGKPLIIGSLPTERGVVATCSYEARKFGVHSAMNIKEAYRLCPNGVYMHPNFEKYRAESEKLHRIWNDYASASEYIALDEAYLDVTGTAGSVVKARVFAQEIKRRVREEQHLSCSVGLAYSKTAAKTASEEKKPDGYFEILTPEDFSHLMAEREVRAIYTVGERTAEKLNQIGIFKIGEIQPRKEDVIRLLGKQGKMIVDLAAGIDERKVVPYRPEDAKSISREMTFQEDVSDYEFLKHVLLLLSVSVERRAKRSGLHGGGVSLKLTYSDMKSITRSRSPADCGSAVAIWREAGKLLEKVEKRPVRLLGISLYNLSDTEERQLRLEGFDDADAREQEEERKRQLSALEEHYHLNFAGHLPQLFHAETLHKTVEYMRKHF